VIELPLKLVGAIHATEEMPLFDVYASTEKIYLTQDLKHKSKQHDFLRSPITDWITFDSPEDVRDYIEALYEHADEDIDRAFFKPYEHS
jgi:hypothetical protein